MPTTQEMRVAWSPACSIVYRPVLLDTWRYVDAVMLEHRYEPRAGETWGFNCRKITGGSGYSLHSYRDGPPQATFVFWSGVKITVAIAVDINSRTNPYGPRLVTDMPRPMVDKILRLRTVEGVVVLRWGGYFSGNKDAMHFEVNCTPAQLAKGLALAGPPRPTVIAPEDTMQVMTATHDLAGYWLAVEAPHKNDAGKQLLGWRYHMNGDDLKGLGAAGHRNAPVSPDLLNLYEVVAA